MVAPPCWGLVRDIATPAFRRERFERLHDLDEHHFWFVARRERIVDLVARYAPAATSVVDVGCGTGRMLRSVAPVGARTLGVDIHTPSGNDRRVGRAVAKTDALPVRQGSADLVLALDVLEHVDDELAMREMHGMLRRSGRLILTVPAYTFLWSFRDVDAGHQRRYTARRARSLVRRNGFAVVAGSYYLTLLFPVVLVSRLIGRRWAAARDAEEAVGASANRILMTLLRIENHAARAGVRLPFGSSIVLVAERL